MCKKMIYLVSFVLVLMSVPVFGQNPILAPSNFIIAIDADGNSQEQPGELVEEAIDGILGGSNMKYLNFGEENSGFIVTPSVESCAVSIRMWTANDAEERDPSSWALYGTNEPIVSPEHSTGTSENWTLIASGPVSLPAQRNDQVGVLVTFDNTTYYKSYKLLFLTVKNAGATNCMQIAEVQFYGFKSKKSSSPTPADGAINMAKQPIRWLAGETAVAHDVYFGTNRTAVENATPDSPEWIEQLGAATLMSITAANLEKVSTTYYWRIDEVEEGGTVYKGDIWTFTTAPLKAHSPNWPDGDVFCDVNSLLSWGSGFKTKGTNGHYVFLGTDRTAVLNANSSTPVIYKGIKSATNYTTGILPNNTTIYWRIDELDAISTTSKKNFYKGDVWQYTTTLTGLGSILRELWLNMLPRSTSLTMLYGWPTFPYSPDQSDLLTSFDTIPGLDDFGGRIHGWFYPPRTGDYTFYLASDDNGELWLSTDQSPAMAQLIAYETASAGDKAWQFGNEMSDPIHLETGRRYYISALWKEGGGGDNCAVGFTGPGYPSITVLPGRYLQPFVQYWAYNPNPANGTSNVGSTPTLSWLAGKYAVSHNVYIGSDAAAVLNATTSTAGIYKGNQVGLTYPAGSLALSTICYWRIDEVNNLHLDKLWKGEVWAFRTVGGAGGLLGMYFHWTGPDIPIPPEPFLTLVLSRIDPTVDFDWGDGSPDPSVNIDKFSGRWVGHVEVPIAGKYNFYTITDDGAHLYLDGQLVIDQWVLQGMTVVNSGFIDLTAGLHDIQMEFFENYGGAGARLGWQGPIVGSGIIKSIYLWPPLKATVPLPYDGDPEAPSTAILSWRPGDKAAKLAGHDVYFGTDFDDVNEATTSSPSSIYRGRRDPNTYDPPEQLEMNQTYYWRVDEVNLPSIWRGNVWSFTVANYLVVEDYERYTNTPPLIIWQTWIAGGGGKAGYSDPNYAELSIIHGGRQSMPFDYDNTKLPYYSEAGRTFTPTQDWTAYGVKALSLWLRGWPVSVGSFVENPAGIYTMTASGTDIWDVPDLRRPSRFHDEFHYAYIQVSGNYAIKAKVESITYTDGWANAGVMIRDSIDANSAHAMTCLTPDPCNGVALLNRAVAGGPSNYINIPDINPPYWIVLERVVDTFTAYYSADGSTWNTLGSTTVTMTNPVYIGLSLTACNTAATCTAVFSNVAFSPSVTPSWTHQDIGIKSNVAAPVYVTLQDSGAKTATITHDDPTIVLNSVWQPWDIALRDFAGVDLTKIQKITLGVGNVGTGTLYFDDIRLYPPRCMPDLVKPLADFTDDCFVDYADLAILTDNWLVKPPSGVSSGLKGYWPFNGNLQDVSGNGRNGSDPCGVITYAAGHAGQAASLNGGYVLVGPVGISGAAARTVAGWAKASTMGMPSDFINVFGFTSRSGTLDNRSFDIEKWGYGNDYAIHVYGWEQAILPVDLEWHHLAASYDGTTIRWYGDGQLVGEDSSRVLDTNDLVQMGERGDISANFQGMIDEVRIYSRALSWAEIEYLAGKPMIDINNDGAVDFRDYTILADMWLEEVLWPQ